MEEVKVINAEQYGLEKKDAKELTIGLDVVVAEREILIESYKSVIELEVTKESIPLFKELRLKIGKNRTQGIDKWHKKSKAFFLTGGRFVDAIKNREIDVNTNMESKLLEAENTFINLEKQRIEKIQLERNAACLKFEDEAMILSDLSTMPDSIWSNYILGLETKYNARIEAERLAEEIRLEDERINKLHFERRDILIPFQMFSANILDFNLCEFGKISEVEYLNIKTKLENAKEVYETKQAEISKENERLKEEAALKDKLAAELKAKQDKVIATQKAESDKKLKEEKQKADKLAAELKAKQDAEKAAKLTADKEQAAKLEADRKASLAPEKDKLTLWIDSFNINSIDLEGFSESGKATANVITQKFESFKNWAEQQKDSIK